MNIRHLEIFRAVCRNKSITKASQELYMTQPAISIAIKELEEFYETKLFDRMSRKIYLTKSGEKLLAYTNTILNQLDLSISDIRDQNNLVTCRIGVNVTIGEAYLSNIIHHLTKKLPDLQLQTSIENVQTIEEKFLNNEYDFLITDSPRFDVNFSLEKLYGEPMLLVCGIDYHMPQTITIKDLAQMDLLLREKGSGCRRVIDAIFEKNECFIEPKIESISHLSLLELTKNNLGIAIMPKSLVIKEIEEGHLKCLDLLDSSFTREYYLVYHPNKYLTPIILECMNEIRKLFASL